ncbi:CoxG family protein [Georgenia sp. SYP-B2076]|uniref:CoxG family protein n=1 Tax=Georgenia sp. SYP-B2076 TaxID=2495881 RepID=UPI000F8F7691|nr:SRPBCC domain-containing protein [Georgenia sp. SYP-B2076]
MKLDGTFDTPAGPDALRALATSPEVLAAVPAFRDVEVADDGALRVAYYPVISLGPIRFVTTITAGEVTDTTAEVAVRALRGSNLVDADLLLTFEAADGGSRVRWEAEVMLGGTAASVGQRVGAEIVTRAIDDVLRAAAGAAAGAGVPA